MQYVFGMLHCCARPEIHACFTPPMRNAMKKYPRTKSNSHRKISNSKKRAPQRPKEITSEGPASDIYRCRFCTSDGRRCRMPREGHRAFCRSHAIREDEALAPSRATQELLSLSGEFKTARDINHILGKLWVQLVQGKIARGDAVALAYIGQLLLQTLPTVRGEIKEFGGSTAWQETLREVFAAVRARDERAKQTGGVVNIFPNQSSNATAPSESMEEEDETEESDADVDEDAESTPSGVTYENVYVNQSSAATDTADSEPELTPAPPWDPEALKALYNEHLRRKRR